MKKEIIILAVVTSFSAETIFHHKPNEHDHKEVYHADNTMNAVNVYGMTGNTISQATITGTARIVTEQGYP